MKSLLVHGSLYLCVGFVCVFCKVSYVTYPEVVSVATTFSARVKAKSCLLQPDEGPCRADIRMFYYNPKSRSCAPFQWGGCQGNGNRFDSVDDCRDYCLSKPNQPVSRPNWCKLTFDYGFCFGALERWYYDNLWKVCKKTLYSGCGGNKNNFYSKEQCESICLFGKGPIRVPTTARDGMKKVLIINPWDTTVRRGRDQTLAPAHGLASAGGVAPAGGAASARGAATAGGVTPTGGVTPAGGVASRTTAAG